MAAAYSSRGPLEKSVMAHYSLILSSIVRNFLFYNSKKFQTITLRMKTKASHHALIHRAWLVQWALWEFEIWDMESQTIKVLLPSFGHVPKPAP